jgi:hypothetical protein
MIWSYCIVASDLKSMPPKERRDLGLVGLVYYQGKDIIVFRFNYI